MPSLAVAENDAPVLTLSSAAGSAPLASTPIKGLAKLAASPRGPLQTVDANVPVHGHCPPSSPSYLPPPPPASSPPPLPLLAFDPYPDTFQYPEDTPAAAADDYPQGYSPGYQDYYRHTLRHARSDVSLSSLSSMSTASSTDMNGHGGSSSGGAASSHATTAPADDDGASYDGKDYHDGRDSPIPRPRSAASIALSLTQPTRPPPPPPPSALPPSLPSFSVLPPLQPFSPTFAPTSPVLPEAPTDAPPPPPPPKPDSLRPARPLPNGGPVTVSNPLANRSPTPASTPAYASQRTSQPQLHVDRTDPSALRNSVASTTGSSILSASPPGRSDYAAGPSANPSSHAAASLPPHMQQLSISQQSLPAHRFSSPPAYIPGSSSLPHPPPPPKQRHTLEVPKSTTSRASRDGVDVATLASGRFSPTAAGGSGNGSIAGSTGGRRPSLSLARRNTRSMHSELPRDEVVPDEDALRWTEAYRQKRASKKRRLEDDDQVLVGTKVDETHANWVNAYNMLTGIRVSVSRTNAKLDRPLTDEDFNAKQKSTFDIAGNELVPSAKYDFKFKDYAPWVFRHLRALFHLDPADYLMSLAGKYILSELGSPGKSGSFFYFSRDYKYIIKTIHHAEHKFLRKILKEYYQHVTDNPNTLLSQFFGLHRVKMPYGRKIHFVVMNNLFPPHRDIHQTFDLKGSTIGRDYPEERAASNPRATLKDLNWLRRHEHLELGMIKKRLFLEQLQKDVKLLQRLQIMDYSLLVGIHDLRRGNEENLRDKTLQVFEPGPSGPGGPGDDPNDPQSVLMRTPSRLEHQRKTRELRQMLKSERPIPIGQSNNRMPDELDDSKQSVFYKDNGGFQATHQDNAPANEVYYLGVIDCLTHYGMIKKIEHFWKGLSSDRSKISALPPQQYGDRFFNFVSGITMSPEEAALERAQVAAAAEAEAAAAAAGPAGDAQHSTGGDEPPSVTIASGRDKGKGVQQSGNWSSGMRHRGAGGAGAPDGMHAQPSAGYRTSVSPSRGSADGERMSAAAITAAHRAAEYDATQKGSVVHGDDSVARQSGSPPPDRRESAQQAPILPVVEEAAEASSTGGQSSRSRFSGRDLDERPPTPAKDSSNSLNGHYKDKNGKLPMANSFLKPDSADSGYGVSGSGTRSRSGTVNSVGSGRKLGRNSLEKELPPLPPLSPMSPMSPLDGAA